MTSDMLSQEEIDALLKGNEEEELEVYEDESTQNSENELTAIEIDALGEIGNISMGTAATTLSTLLNRKVNITTPTVEVTTAEELSKEYVKPFVAVDVSYKSGLEGSNILILNSNDAKIITDLMMGKDEFDIERELSELDLSAVSEAMNQMMGSSSTSLSEMFMKVIDIEPPNSMEITFAQGQDKIDMLNGDSFIIKISFKMVIGDSIDSNIMQLIPLTFGRKMVDSLMNPKEEIKEVKIESKEYNYQDNKNLDINQSNQEINTSSGQSFTASNDNGIHQNTNYNTIANEEEMVIVKKPEFKSFTSENAPNNNGSIDLVGDIPVDIVVELGKTSRKISEILAMGQGTVLELDKLVGEPLNIYANGKFIASGEVVVIDDSFGVRVTEIENTKKSII